MLLVNTDYISWIVNIRYASSAIMQGAAEVIA